MCYLKILAKSYDHWGIGSIALLFRDNKKIRFKLIYENKLFKDLRQKTIAQIWYSGCYFCLLPVELRGQWG